jgi:hypothetical protein
MKKAELQQLIKGEIDNVLNENQNLIITEEQKMYSEKDMIEFMQFIVSQKSLDNTGSVSVTTAKYYLEQFKNKS